MCPRSLQMKHVPEAMCRATSSLESLGGAFAFWLTGVLARGCTGFSFLPRGLAGVDRRPLFSSDCAVVSLFFNIFTISARREHLSQMSLNDTSGASKSSDSLGS